ncbi:MAG: 50S ribosomal protein L21 [Planctomycetota bacterium]|nr:50S ribosomal protein L21 [Planctomycetota bacterium]
MYAILSDRGRQYRVTEGALLLVDRMPGQKGAAVAFEQVLLVGQDGGQVKVGAPHVAGARVTGVLEEHIKGAKLIAHHRVWTNSLGRRRGHRTAYTVVRIQKIEA